MEDLELQQIAGEALIAQGLWTPEAVAADRLAMEARINGEAEPQAPAKAPVSASATLPSPSAQPGPVDPLDELAFAGPASPTAYNFGTAPQGVEISLEQEAHFREVFHREGIPSSIGNRIGELWNQAVANPPTPEQLELGYQTGYAALNRMWGANTDRNLKVADAEVQRMAKTNPQIKDMLRHSGLGNSPWLASTLYNFAKSRGRA